jgi:hypothetical protein
MAQALQSFPRLLEREGYMARWDLMTSEEIGAMIANGRDLAILPVGATEQHGPHLACGCDTISAETLARLAGERAAIRRNGQERFRCIRQR